MFNRRKARERRVSNPQKRIKLPTTKTGNGGVEPLNSNHV